MDKKHFVSQYSRQKTSIYFPKCIKSDTTSKFRKHLRSNFFQRTITYYFFSFRPYFPFIAAFYTLYYSNMIFFPRTSSNRPDFWYVHVILCFSSQLVNIIYSRLRIQSSRCKETKLLLGLFRNATESYPSKHRRCGSARKLGKFRGSWWEFGGFWGGFAW